MVSPKKIYRKVHRIEAARDLVYCTVYPSLFDFTQLFKGLIMVDYGSKMHAVILLLFVHYTVYVCAFFGPVALHTNYRVGASSNNPINLSSISTTLYIATRDQSDATTAPTDEQTHPPPSINIRLEAFASSGIHCKSELPRILDTISSVCEDYGMPLNTNNIIQQQCSELPSTVDSISGVLGRVLLIKVHGVPVDYDLDENEIFSQLNIDLSERIDIVLSNSEGRGDEGSSDKQNQPILKIKVIG